jgi:hypothetical protein
MALLNSGAAINLIDGRKIRMGVLRSDSDCVGHLPIPGASPLGRTWR